MHIPTYLGAINQSIKRLPPTTYPLPTPPPELCHMESLPTNFTMICPPNRANTRAQDARVGGGGGGGGGVRVQVDHIETYR